MQAIPGPNRVSFKIPYTTWNKHIVLSETCVYHHGFQPCFRELAWTQSHSHICHSYSNSLKFMREHSINSETKSISDKFMTEHSTNSEWSKKYKWDKADIKRCHAKVLELLDSVDVPSKAIAWRSTPQRLQLEVVESVSSPSHDETNECGLSV